MLANSNILVLTHWSFSDALVQVATLPYLRIIRRIVPPQYRLALVTWEPKGGLTRSQVDEINTDWSSDNLSLITFDYRRMGPAKLILLAVQLVQLLIYIKKNRVGVIHAFCTTAGAIGYLLSCLSGARLVLDSFEPHAESMVECGTWQTHSFAYQALHALECLQARRAFATIAATESVKQWARESLGVELQRFHVRPACVDPGKFCVNEAERRDLAGSLRLNDKIVAVYSGKLGGIYLQEEIFDFVRECYVYWGPKFRFLLLSNVAEADFQAQLKKAELPPETVILRFVAPDQVPRYLALADFAINGVKPVPSKRHCSPIKDGEYWAAGLPLVLARGISDDSDLVENKQIGVVLDDFSRPTHQRAVRGMAKLLDQDSAGLKERIRRVAVDYRGLQIAQAVYLAVYESAFSAPV